MIINLIISDNISIYYPDIKIIIFLYITMSFKYSISIKIFIKIFLCDLII